MVPSEQILRADAKQNPGMSNYQTPRAFLALSADTQGEAEICDRDAQTI